MALSGRQGRGSHRHTDTHTHMQASEQSACPPADKTKCEKGAKHMSTCNHLASSVMSVSSHLAWCIEALGSKSVMQESANKHGCMQLACHCLAVSQLIAFRGGQGCIPTCRNLNQTCMVLAQWHMDTTCIYIYTYSYAYMHMDIYICIYTHVHLNI